MSEPINVEIQNVNGVRDLCFNLGEPGVYVLRGKNGAGKTSAINAVMAAAGARDAVAEPTDGQESGQVLVGGVRMVVGARRLTTGAPSIHLADSASLGAFIEPGLRDEKAGNKRRIEALLRMVPIPADDAAKKELTANDLPFASTVRGYFPDALTLGIEIARAANAEALALEKEAAKHQGEVDVYVREINSKVIPMSVFPLDVATARCNEAKAKAAIAESQAKAREELVRQQNQIKATIGERPDVRAALADRDQKVQAVKDLQLQLALAKHALEAAIAKVAHAQKTAMEWDAQSEILRRPIEGPTLKQAEELKQLAVVAEKDLENARAAAEFREKQQRMADAKQASDAALGRAEHYRKMAKRVPYALGRLLERAGIPGLSIDEKGILCVQAEDGSMKPFADRLSFGQRVRLALDLSLQAHKQRAGSMPCTLQLEPEFWLALDAAHRAEVVAQAKALGVYVLTEEPAEGELRVENASMASQETRT